MSGKLLNYRYSPEMYEPGELDSTWKIYKGYNPDMNFFPDSIHYNLYEISYYSFISDVMEILAKDNKIELFELGHPTNTIKSFNGEINKESVDFFGVNKKASEYGTIFYSFKYSKNFDVDIIMGISYSIEGGLKKINSIEFVFPPVHVSSTLQSFVIETVKDIIQKSYEKNKISKKNKVNISMLNQNSDGFYLDEFDITKKTSLIKEYDLFYGKGFKEFNDKIINRLSSDSKGLILFHGEPGTGKTFYIKSLIHEIQSAIDNAIVIYTPVGMIESLNGPSFLNLLKENSNKNIILLIEDAEEILTDRKVNQFTSSISNILNSTSGILNDIFGISIIATFNSDISTIDKALLRNERLLAIKDFKMKTKDEALEIAKYLNIEKQFKNSEDFNKKSLFSIADITSKIDSHDIISHEMIEKSKKIGF